ncbi:MAG: 50S ribosomal protein L18Ae [Candidatus Micrarchaeia archaeon]
MKFVVQGLMYLGGKARKFSKAVEAPSERAAREQTYALLGAAHGLKRPYIKIERIEMVSDAHAGAQ